MLDYKNMGVGTVDLNIYIFYSYMLHVTCNAYRMAGFGMIFLVGRARKDFWGEHYFFPERICLLCSADRLVSQIQAEQTL